ncbi:MAG: PadR family transcriptional regulator [Bdellovibrionales bacterium]
MISSELLKGSMTTLVLKTLQKKSMYGYQIMKELEHTSNGGIEVKEGTLYPILHALETDGAVESEWSDGLGERKRKYYKITKKGRALLKERASQWAAFRKMMDQVLAAERACEN